MKHLIIIGGGIAGLSTAYYVQKQAQTLDLKITLIEKDKRLGGKITTDAAQGFVIEGGPDSFITQKPWGLQLCRELGLEDDLIGTNDDRRNIYILRHGKLHPMPDGLMLVVPTRFWPFVTTPILSWRGKLRMGMDLFIKPRSPNGDESLADFMGRRLGREALEVLGEPMMAGIHVADADTLSLKATFPRFIDIEQEHGSLIRGMIAAKRQRPASPSKQSLFMTMKGGLRELVAALEQAIHAEFINGVGVQSVSAGEQGATVIMDDGTVHNADAVILATPSYTAADMLQNVPDPDYPHPRPNTQGNIVAGMLQDIPDRAIDLLRSIRYVSTATVSLGYRQDEFTHPLDGFGFVIPRTEPTRLLACTWTSTKFNHRAPNEHVLLRAFIGGPRQQELVALDDAALIKLVREELAQIMNVRAEPTIARVFRWHRANPQYDVGHLERVDDIESLLPAGIYVTGSAYRGVGIPDCVYQGQQTAEKVVAYLKSSRIKSFA